MRVTVIGAEGFVGSAFVRLLERKPEVELLRVTRRNVEELAGTSSDVVIEAACNSKKYLADQDPLAEFDASVTHRLRTLLQFPAALHVHLSSVDVYSDLTSPATTREDMPIDPAQTSRYGVHKRLAEQLVKHYAPRWLILRLAGMVGPGLKKNPVYDILNDNPLRVHPDSRYQYALTDDIAAIAWSLATSGQQGETFNLCAQGTITMRKVAALAGRSLDLSALTAEAAPRIVEASTEKLAAHCPPPQTKHTLETFLGRCRPVE